ncbi:MAG: MGMT family protein [Eggerthellaceae bacterium]|nr:MGMT family protein [Eggerthellaceae bacterium]
MGAFSDSVFSHVARIPRGKVSTYGQIARLIGSPRSARYVGYALRTNPSPGMDANDIPCHRVVFKDGSLCKSFIFGGPDEQRSMLEEEGVSFLADGRIDMDACLWEPRESEGAPASSGNRTSGSSEESYPSAPPADFDWKRELGEL